ncbi:MAG TPA: glycerol-3-phosphate 1-O-acyltransferase PlsY [Phycisphaerales bacterium]|nr:glycerol-3-phosphate 1-O-acyltransferase PlsY [Phycisphaerales bacterium]
MLTWIILIIVAYLAGSIPFGLVVGKLHGIDIREHGSKNIGATNVGRVLGRKSGMVCFLLDVLKGAVPVIIAGVWMGTLNVPARELTQSTMWMWMLVAMATVIGHMYSIFIGFKGGKGVATGFGALAGMWLLLTIPAFVGIVIWATAVRLTKYVSVASILAGLAIPVCYAMTIIGSEFAGAGARLLHASPPLIVTSLLALLIIYKHRANIARLRRGEEPRVGERAAKNSS